MLRVTEVHFNHDPESAAHDALTIQQNPRGPVIRAPEWRENEFSKAAAYTIQSLKDSITIKVGFAGGPPNSVVRIRAVAPSGRLQGPKGCLGLLINGSPQRASSNGGAFGSTLERTVVFDGEGRSTLEDFPIEKPFDEILAVGIHDVELIWQSAEGDSWTTFGASEHQIFTILDAPSRPWQCESLGDDTLELPWVDALQVACGLATGARTTDQAARLVTEGINAHPALFYTGSTVFGDEPDGEDYSLSFFLLQLRSGLPMRLNCTDCANAVTTLANLLGCDLSCGRIESLLIGDIDSLLTKPVLLIGGDPRSDKDWDVQVFDYHEVAWLGSPGYQESVYDSCLRLAHGYDGNGLPKSLLALRMQFGSCESLSYANRFLQYSAYTLELIARRRLVV